MKPIIIGRAVLLIFILISVLMAPLGYSGPITKAQEVPVTIVELPVTGAHPQKNSVLFQRVIAELVKTFYIA